MALQVKYARVLKADYAVPVFFYDSYPPEDELKADIIATVPVLKPLSEVPVRSTYISAPYAADNSMIYNSSTSKMTYDDIMAITEGYIFEPNGDIIVGGLIGGAWSAAPQYFFGLPNKINKKPALSAFITCSDKNADLSEWYPVITVNKLYGYVEFGAYRADGTNDFSRRRAMAIDTEGTASGSLNVETYLVLYDEPVFEEEPTYTYDRTQFLSGLAMGLTGKGNPTFEGGTDAFTKGYLTGAELRRKRVIPEAT